jgi:RNA-directed DNA polymerase
VEQGVAPSRRYRTICIPDPTLLRVQRWIAQNILSMGKVHEASTAYAPGSDIVKAAARHCCCRWLVKMDAQKFFESISETKVYVVFRKLGYGPLISFELARLCTRVDSKAPRRKAPWFHSTSRGISFYMTTELGHLPQGAPTSPMLANLAVYWLDYRLAHLAKKEGFIYTRYADDLTFSTVLDVSRETAARLANRVEQEMKCFGLEANRQKTKIAAPGARKIVLSLLVDRDRPRLTRAFRDNLETHVFALTHPDIGPLRHQTRRGFASVIGLHRHVEGLLHYAHHVDPEWAEALQGQLKQVARAFPLRIGWTTHSCACAAKTWAMRSDFDRRPVSDLGFMRLRLLGLLRRLRAG